MRLIQSSFLLLAGAFLQAATFAQTTVFSDSFSYPNGNLVGQGSWTQTGATATTPIQVSGSAGVVGNTGQDVYAALTSGTIPYAANNSKILTTLSANVTASQSVGDYFVHLGTTVGSTSGFYDKIFAKSGTSSGILLFGLSGNAATGVYGTTELTLGTTYNLLTVWTFKGGASADTISLYVNPTTADGSGDTAYLNYTFLASEAAPTGLSEVNLRQGSSTAGPTVTVDNLGVQFTAVPEASVVGALAIGAILLLTARRRRRV
ncbi:MAG: trimeric autotransporter adhesin [Chthoniobacter sp.]|nr:trimeric autotransporter adhesin [Chthoniobacter sp.]